MQTPFLCQLTDTESFVYHESAQFHSAQLTPKCDIPWTVRKQRLRGGKQDGVDLVEIDNGAMRIRVLPTRGMCVLDAHCGDVRLGWDSPVKEIVHPALVDPHARGGLGWIAGFNEYVARCGLEWFGAPCGDARHHAKGEAPASNLTLHGKLQNTPAAMVELEVQMVPPYRITLRGLVRERGLFSPNLDLGCELSTTPGSNTFHITDHITNGSAGTQEFGILYHLNHGRPLLEQGSTLIAPALRVTPMTDRALDGGVENYHKYAAPKYGYTEQNYALDLATDRKGITQVMLANKAKSRGVSIAYEKKTLPHFVVWKNTQHEKDGYVTGLEPCTHYPFPRPYERKQGRVPKLRSGQTYVTGVSITVQRSKREVTQAGKQIAGLLRGRKTIIEKDVPTVSAE